jgi:hypothetical protein
VIPSLFALADSQVTDVPPFAGPRYAFAGLDLPLPFPYGLVRPGLAHPPPGRGDGLRDNDMGILGVPGIGGKIVRLLRDGELSGSTPDDSWVLRLDGMCELDADAADERRRR